MATDVVAFALLAAILWGIYPIVLKKGLERGGNTLQATMVAILVGVVVLWGTLLVRFGPIGLLQRITPAMAAVFLLSGLVGSVLGRLANYTGVDRIGASVTSAVIATNPLFAAIFALGFLGEPILAQELFGMLAIICGIILLSLSKGGDIRGWRRSELVFPIFAGIAYGAGHTIRRYGMVSTPATSIEGVALNELAALAGLGAYLLIRYSSIDVVRGSRQSYKFFIATGAIGMIALLALFEALARGRVIIAVPLVSTATLWTVLFTTIFLRDIERITPAVVVGAILVVIGAILIGIA